MIGKLEIDDSSAPSRESLLADFLAEVWGRPYQLGQWDCILFIAAWGDRLMAQGGCASRSPSLTSQFRGQYTTEPEGIRHFARHGINPAIQAALTVRGWTSVAINRQSSFLPGDIVLTDLHHPGIYDGRAILAQPGRSCGLLLLHFGHGRLGLRWV